MAYTIKLGKHKVGVEFADGGTDVSLGALTNHYSGYLGAQALADVAQDVVALHVTTEQIAIDQRRVIEDAQRILGS